MAEIVQKRMELFAPAILELRESNIFTEEELNKLVNRVKKNEHKMVGGAKSVDAFKSAIKYEEGVLNELMKRKNAKNSHQKHGHLNWIFIKRIVNIYRRGLKHFSADYDFNMAYFDFLKYFPEEHRHITNEHVRRMIQVFSHEPDVFKKGAGWFFLCDKIDDARNILLRGQALHPMNLDLYLDLIELEIRNHTAKGIEKRLMKYVDAMVKNNVTYRFLQEIITIFENYDNLREVIDYTIEQLLSKYRDNEEVWNHIALRELKGEYFPAGDEDKRSTMYSVERAIMRYKEGISKLPLEKQPLLWKKYLDTLVDLLKDYFNPQTVSFLREALDEADAQKIKLDETHYVAWMDCCGNNDALLVKKLEEGTKVHSKSIMLWAVYLKHYILRDEWEFANQVFRRAVTSLGANAAKIWELYLDFHMLKSPVAELDALFEEAVSQPYLDIVIIFKSRFLSWTLLAKGIEAARELYLRLANKPPYSKKLHEEMYLAEQMEHANNGSLNLRKTVLELWTKQFAREDPEVYLRRIAAVEKSLDANEKIAEIYEEAIRNLSYDKVIVFKNKYNERDNPENLDN